jgi:hypothetical protein
MRVAYLADLKEINSQSNRMNVIMPLCNRDLIVTLSYYCHQSSADFWIARFTRQQFFEDMNALKIKADDVSCKDKLFNNFRRIIPKSILIWHFHHLAGPQFANFLSTITMVYLNSILRGDFVFL